MKTRLTLALAMGMLPIFGALGASASGLLGAHEMDAFNGGCQNHCESGHTCGVDADACWTGQPPLLPGYCYTHDDCGGYYKQQDTDLWNCKPGAVANCPDCPRDDEHKFGCGPVHYCKCFDMGYGIYMCDQWGVAYGHQYDYYPCTPQGGPPELTCRNGGSAGGFAALPDGEADLSTVLANGPAL